MVNWVSRRILFIRILLMAFQIMSPKTLIRSAVSLRQLLFVFRLPRNPRVPTVLLSDRIGINIKGLNPNSLNHFSSPVASFGKSSILLKIPFLACAINALMCVNLSTGMGFSSASSLSSGYSIHSWVFMMDCSSGSSRRTMTFTAPINTETFPIASMIRVSVLSSGTLIKLEDIPESSFSNSS